MKKGYIMVFLAIWVILISLIIGFIIFSNIKKETGIEVSEKNEIIDNNIQVVTTMADEEEKEMVYLIKEYKGNIAIYVIDEQGKEHLREVTHILTKYLTNIDIERLKEGIRVEGKEALNKALEDYE